MIQIFFLYLVRASFTHVPVRYLPNFSYLSRKSNRYRTKHKIELAGTVGMGIRKEKEMKPEGVEDP